LNQSIEKSTGKGNPSPFELLALWYAVHGDMKYLSHRDSMRMWAKAMVRARLAVCYSEGFNPHIRMTLPLPRSVGMNSDRELILVRFRRREDLPTTMAALQRNMPGGVMIVEGRWVPTNTPTAVAGARYALEITSAADPAEVDRRIGDFNTAQSWPVHRAGDKNHPARTIDLRQSVERMDRRDNNVIFYIRNNPGGAARIDELRQTLGLDPPDRISRVSRIETRYESPLLVSAPSAAEQNETANL
jgi:radical SAM-linked protein